MNTSGTALSVYSEQIAADPSGNIFFAAVAVAPGAGGANVVLRLDSVTGMVTLVAGNGANGFSGDNGPATSAQLSGVAGLAVDSAGNVYIADSFNNRIRLVANGVITTVAGNGTPGFSGDGGSAAIATLNKPGALALGSTGSLYIADMGNHRVRRFVNGVINTIAGNGAVGFGGDNGPATKAQLALPTGLAADSAGNLYIADGAVNRVRKISNGVITTVATGIGFNFNFNGGAVAVDPAGNLYIADTGNARVLEVSNGMITTVAGGGVSSSGSVPLPGVYLDDPRGLAVDYSGNLYIADTLNYRLLKFSNGSTVIVAGNGMPSFSGDNGPAANAQLYTPSSVAVDLYGNLYIADTGNFRVRKVSNGIITSVAGGGPLSPGNSGDNGPATSAHLYAPNGVAVDYSGGSLYISDNVIRRVSNGVITTVAGNWAPGSGGNGCRATYYGTLSGAIAVDSGGNLYIATPVCILKLSNGVITAVAGNGTRGFSGDNGPATSAQLSGVSSVAVDAVGSLYIADTDNSRVRKVSNGVITTVAGSGEVNGPLGDGGPATSASLGYPTAVAVDSAGNVYIADTGNRVRKISGGLINTIAGSPLQPFGFGFAGDGGPATSALMFGPKGVAVDSCGHVYVADSANNRIRLLTPDNLSGQGSGLGPTIAAPKRGRTSPSPGSGFERGSLNPLCTIRK